MAYTQEDITAQNTFTEWITVENGLLVITGTGFGTVTLQNLQKGSYVVTDVDQKTEAGVYTFDGNGGVYRAGVKTGDYSSAVKVTLNG